jgi:hypothetical protein
VVLRNLRIYCQDRRSANEEIRESADVTLANDVHATNAKAQASQEKTRVPSELHFIPSRILRRYRRNLGEELQTQTLNPLGD